MGKKRSSGLTPRQQEWRRHVEACARGGETVRAYAKRHGFSADAMYQAAKDLRRRGVLPASARGRSNGKKPSFVKVSAAVRSTSSGTWRVRFPSGLVFESSAPLAHDELLSLLAALAAPR